MEINLITDSGALTVKKLIERPSFPPELSRSERTLFLYPDDRADVAAELYGKGGERLRHPYEIEAVLCYLLGVRRGIPNSALTVKIYERLYELPIGIETAGEILIPIEKKAKISRHEVDIYGGIVLSCYTLFDNSVVRITEAEENTDYPTSLLRRLSVVDTLATAESAIAYRISGNTVCYTTTDTVPSYDSAVYLAKHLACRGMRGEYRLLLRGKSYTFRITDDEIILVAKISDAKG